MAQNVARVWNTGTPENPIFNFELPSGAKGEPGGWNAGVSLGSSDLNTVTAPGLYYQSSASVIVNNGAALNYPPPLTIGGARTRFTMSVQNWGGNGAVKQIINTVGTATTPGITCSRYLEPSNAPSAWTTQVAQRVDQTAGRVIYTWDEVNNREQMIYGDTGWRNIASLLIADNFTVTPDAGRCHIRRINNQVQLVMRFKATDTLHAKVQSKNASVLPMLELPAGFRESPATYGLPFTATTQLGTYMETLAFGGVNSSTQLKIQGSSTVNWRNTEIISASATWVSEATWPTELPGIAA